MAGSGAGTAKRAPTPAFRGVFSASRRSDTDTSRALNTSLSLSAVHRVVRSKATALPALRCRPHTSGVALKWPTKTRDLPSPPRPTKGDGSKTEFATPAIACQECETRCQKARLAACRPTHKATRTANRRPARQRHRHGSGWQARAGVLSRGPQRQAAPCAPAVVRWHHAAAYVCGASEDLLKNRGHHREAIHKSPERGERHRATLDGYWLHPGSVGSLRCQVGKARWWLWYLPGNRRPADAL